MSAAASFVTLTYGRVNGADHPNAQHLDLRDVQNYFKRLRRNENALRYFVVGEYGSQKGRAHWHVLAFWQEAAPAFLDGERNTLNGEVMRDGDAYPEGGSFEERHWPHGRCLWHPLTVGTVRYVLSYLTKEVGQDRRADRKKVKFTMSKKPVLGAAFFDQLAGQCVEQGLTPQAPNYHFRDVRKRARGARPGSQSVLLRDRDELARRARRDHAGELVEYRLSGEALNYFAESFLRQWRERYGGVPPPAKGLVQEHNVAVRDAALHGQDRDWLADWCDRHPDRVAGLEVEPLPFTFTGRTWGGVLPKPHIDCPLPDGRVAWSERVNTYECVSASTQRRLYWSHDEKGERAWHEKVRGRAAAERLRDPETYRRAKSEAAPRPERDPAPMRGSPAEEARRFLVYRQARKSG